MSSSPLSAIINALTQVAAANYVGLAVTAMVVYEYLITLDREVAAVWKRKFAATSMLLLSVRWVMLLIQIIDWLPSTPGRCKPLGILEQVLIVIAYVQTALFSALRACAIWERNLTIFLVVICLGLVPAATNIFAITRGSYQYVGAPFYTCESAVSLSPKLDQIFTFLDRSCLIAMDLLVLVLTWVKTYQTIRQAWQLEIPVSFSACLLRDGTWYFVALLAVNIAQMATFDTIASPADVIAESLPSILVSRFLMNLRQIDTEGTEHSRNTPSQMSDVEFTVPRSMLGNLGEPLDDTPSPTVDTESTIVQVVPEASDKEPQSAVEDLGSLPYGENIEEVAREV